MLNIFLIVFMNVLEPDWGNIGGKCYYYNANLPGNELNSCSDKTDTAEKCQELCQRTDTCLQFTWRDKASDINKYKECCMKKAYSGNYEYSSIGLISGPKHCGTIIL